MSGQATKDILHIHINAPRQSKQVGFRHGSIHRSSTRNKIVLTISFGKLLQRDRIVLGRGKLHKGLGLEVRHCVDFDGLVRVYLRGELQMLRGVKETSSLCESVGGSHCRIAFLVVIRAPWMPKLTVCSELAVVGDQ